MRRLQDLDFADDLCLTNQKLQHMQETVEALLNAALRSTTCVWEDPNNEDPGLTRRPFSYPHWKRRYQKNGLCHLLWKYSLSDTGYIAFVRKAQQAFAKLRMVYKARATPLSWKDEAKDNQLKCQIRSPIRVRNWDDRGSLNLCFPNFCKLKTLANPQNILPK